jgi:dTDP-4-dehydrorhamnose reductase
MKILVLGAEGMLGNYVYKYLKSKGLNVAPSVRPTATVMGIDALDSHAWLLKSLFHGYELETGDVVINCIGVINKLVEKVGIENTIIINSLFPHTLDSICNSNGLHLLQISSDCVFSGLNGNYSESDPHDATDIYGKTKSLGEPANSTVIRTSIIGEEKVNKRSLLEWVKSNAGKEIDGYVNHRWNGVTCLRLAQVIGEIIEKDLYWEGVKHIYGDTVTKALLCCMISDIYGLDISIRHKETYICDRTLVSERKDVEFDRFRLYQDIKAQKEFGV